MSILNNADNIKHGSSQINRVYLGSNTVWPYTAGSIWTFPDQPGATINGLSVVFTNSVTVEWGDGDEDILSSAIPVDHTYP